MLERFSVAIERLGPVLAGIMLIPSGLALGVLGAASGYALAQADQHTLLASAPRYILIVVPVLAVVGPLLLPAADRTNPVRMLLLPISRTTLFVAQSAAALGDIWVLLMLPLVVCIPVGMAAGGAVAGALIAAVAGVLLVVTVLAISSADHEPAAPGGARPETRRGTGAAVPPGASDRGHAPESCGQPTPGTGT